MNKTSIAGPTRWVDDIWMKNSIHEIYMETKNNVIKEFNLSHYGGMSMVIILEAIIMKYPKLGEYIEDLIQDSRDIDNLILAGNMAIGFKRNIKEF